MKKIFTKSLVYMNLLNEFKFIVLKMNCSPVRYSALPKSDQDIRDFKEKIAYDFGTVLNEGFTISLIDKLQSDRITFTQFENDYEIEIVEGKEFADLYVTED